MKLRNLTPFGALCFGALDPSDREHHVVAMRVCYRLAPRSAGWFDAQVIDANPPGLVLADRYSGEVGRSSLLCESDLAPYKPRCDVLVTGSTHAPGGRPAASWTARLRLSRPRRRPAASGSGQGRLAEDDSAAAAAVLGGQDMRVLLDKSVVAHGPRQLRRTWLGGWEMQSALPATSVKLGYERAFGGASRVPAANEQASRTPLLDEVCYQNPLGCGWRDARENKLLEQAGRPLPELLPAPQLEYPDDPITGMCLSEQPRGPLSPAQMSEAVRAEGHRPAGFGAIGRAWTPRLQRAGTYDDAWQRERWPGLPEDFDFGYWNGAPADQQIDHPPPDFALELLNLTDPALTPGGYLVTQLPGHRPFVLMRLKSGVMLPLPMITDTVHVDTDLMQVSLVHRLSIPVSVPVRVLELRFEIDPAAPLVTLAANARPVNQGSNLHG